MHAPQDGAHPRVLELLELLPHPPAAVVRQRVAVLLEQRVDARDAPVPATQGEKGEEGGGSHHYNWNSVSMHGLPLSPIGEQVQVQGGGRGRQGQGGNLIQSGSPCT